MKSAVQIAQEVRAGKLSPIELLKETFSRIETLDPKVGAFLALHKERAMEKAKQIEAKLAKGESLGKLAGVPIAVKDNQHIEGELTTCGSKLLANYVAPFSSTANALLEAEDALLIGKTNLDEFAMGSSNEHSAFQKTCNPWKLDCVPGGSSGGSAAAVSARFCPIALGSETGGSVRQPAGFCGIVGFKPTYGRVSRYGLVAFGSSLDQIGPFTTSVADSALLMEVIGRHDPKDATSLHKKSETYTLGQEIKGRVIGVPWHFLENLRPEVRANFDAALSKLKECGAVIEEVDLDLLKYAIATYYIIATAEASTNLARFDGVRYGVRSSKAKTLDELYDYSRGEGFGSEVKRRILLGTFVLSSGYQNAYFKKAMQVRARITEQFRTLFERVDAIATPTSPTAAFPLGALRDPVEMYLQDIYTVGANLAGLPSLSLPSGFNEEQKPLGLLLTGAQESDALLHTLGHAFEQSTSFSQAVPPQFAEAK